jgi:hypothetical protein
MNSTGMGAMYACITMSDMESYCNLIGIKDARSRSRLVKFIPSMDTVFLEDHAKNMRKAQNKADK